MDAAWFTQHALSYRANLSNGGVKPIWMNHYGVLQEV